MSFISEKKIKQAKPIKKTEFDYSPYEMVEPRIAFIKKELERLTSLVDFEVKGQRVDITGFRLKNLENWRTNSTDNVFDALGPLSGSCNACCSFCPEKKIPFQRDKSFLSSSEAFTRLAYYNDNDGTTLFPSERPYMETFLNPESIDILKAARRKSPHQILIVATNASSFKTYEDFRSISSLKPILIKYSVNVIETHKRKEVMKLEQTPIPQEFMSWCKKDLIPFIASIVLWPDISQELIEKTVAEVEKYEPYGIRLRLPFVHEYTPVKNDIDMDKFWEDAAEKAIQLRDSLRGPLWLEPVQIGRPPITPYIDGIIRNSPVDKAGLKRGDSLVSINGHLFHSRSAIRRYFARTPVSLDSDYTIEICRNGLKKNVHINNLKKFTGPEAYPYSPDLNHPGEQLGMLFLPDFDIQNIEYMAHCIKKHHAKHCVLFTSTLTADAVTEILSLLEKKMGIFENTDLIVYPMKDPWLGGNSYIMEPRLVSAYENHLEKYIKKTGKKPDLLLIPNTIGTSWGIDFKGHSIFISSYGTNIPIELIPWHAVYGKED